MFWLVLSVVLAYLAVAAVLLAFRSIKIIDLHAEFQVVRAREQKMHIKTHAQMLYSGFVSDLIWPVSIFRSARASLSWIRET